MFTYTVHGYFHYIYVNLFHLNIKIKRITEKCSVVSKAGVENHHGSRNKGVMLHPPHTRFCPSAVPYCLTFFHHSEQSQTHTQPGVCTDNSMRLNNNKTKNSKSTFMLALAFYESRRSGR